MQNIIRFGGSPGGSPAVNAQETPSLLSDWKAYAGVSQAAAPSASSSEGGVFKSANETLKGAYGTVSRGVQGLPGNAQAATTGSIPTRTQLTYFAIMLGAGCFFMFIAVVMFLPLIVFMPGKFSSCFSVGACLVIGSFFALKGVKAQTMHMLSKERLPFSISFVGSMVGALYTSYVMHSYLLCLLFSGIEILAVLYYVLSYFPGGTAGLKFALNMIKSSIVGCFRR